MNIKLIRTNFALPGRVIYLDVVDDVEALITDLSEADLVPCWAEIWPSARTLARYIWSNLFLQGQSVLELGSGLGLPGVVCGVRGAHVTFSDYNEEAVKLSLHNAGLNDVCAQGFIGDWRTFGLQERFDIILGSDIFYDPQLNPYLMRICRNNLLPGGQLLLSHQRRQHTYAFVECLQVTLGLTETRIDSIEKDEESVFGHFAVSMHHLQPRIS